MSERSLFRPAGRLVYRGRWILLALSLATAVLVAPYGTQAFGRLSDGGFDDPAADSSVAARWDDDWYGGDTPDVVVLYRHPQVKVGDPRFEQAVHDSLRALPARYVGRLATYWTTGARELRSADGHATYAIVTLRGDAAAKQREYAAIKGLLPVRNLEVKVGGAVPLRADLDDRTAADLARAESISLPVLLVLLVLVFGSLVAAGLPLLVGLFAVLGALALLRLLTEVTEVSVFALNVVTMLGLGLGVDYSLFVLKAFREALGRGASTEEAVVHAVATAGRTVVFSGAVLATSLLGLLLFPQMFLRSIGLGAAAVVLVAMVAALVVLPAALGVLGRGVNALRVTPGLGRSPWGGRGWRAVAAGVTRRPLGYAVVVTAVLLALALPVLHVRFGGVDQRMLPATAESRQVADALDRDFARNSMAPIDVHVLVERTFTERPATPGPLGQGYTPVSAVTPVTPVDVKPFAERLRGLDGVTGIDLAGLSQANGAVRLAVRYSYDPASEQARHLVTVIRSMAPEPNVRRVVVGGVAAAQVDLLAGLLGTLPWMGLAVGGVTFLLLLAALRSVVLPLKALLVNALSIGASSGVIVWGFQDAHLAGILRFTPTGTVEPTVMVLIVAVLFGLSMEYELFLLSRVRGEWLRTGDNTVAVASGLWRTGGLITSAALLLLVVVGAFATADVTIAKLLGVGMFVAVLVDATLVRGLLVPATLRLMGRANWWFPGRRATTGAARDATGVLADGPAGAPGPAAAPAVLPAVLPARPVAPAMDEPARARLPEDPTRTTWEKVTVGRTRVVRADPEGPGWNWVEVDPPDRSH